MPFESPLQFFFEIGGSDDGAYVRDAMSRLQEMKVIGNYYWATTIDEVDLALLEVGPCVAAFDWFSGMDSPDTSGLVHPDGYVRGGHAIDLNGVNVQTGIYRFKNSWGRGWGKNGRFYLKRADLEYLLFGLNGEVALATELNT